MQKSASIQPRTSLSNFESDFIQFFSRLVEITEFEGQAGAGASVPQKRWEGEAGERCLLAKAFRLGVDPQRFAPLQVSPSILSLKRSERNAGLERAQVLQFEKGVKNPLAENFKIRFTNWNVLTIVRK